MSIVIRGHRPDGSRVFDDEGPQVGRLHHRVKGGLPVLGGDLVRGEPGAEEKHRAAVKAEKWRKGQGS